MIRPENKKKKTQANMRDSLSVGDSITTIGGMIGKVVRVDDDKITFETSEDRVRIQIVKGAVSNIASNTDEENKR
jgi:preprotein translocase subunit YajC